MHDDRWFRYGNGDNGRRGGSLVRMIILTVFFSIAGRVYAQDDSLASSGQGYRIDQPGTITFTVGVKISGKVEKPQVVIFLPKEKTLYRREELDRSYKQELDEPLPFAPLLQ